MTQLIPISDARATLPDLVTHVSDTYSRAIITVNGKPKTVMISVEELESLEETAEVLAIPGIREDIRRSREEIKRGEYASLDDIVL